MIQALLIAVTSAISQTALTPQQDAWGEVMFNMALCRDHIPAKDEAEILKTSASMKDEYTSRILVYAYAMGLQSRDPIKFDIRYCSETMPVLIEKALRITEK